MHKAMILFCILFVGCGDLAVYEAVDTRTDGAAEAQADARVDSAVGEAGGDVVDSAVDTGADTGADVGTDTADADALVDAAPDVFMCPVGSLVCAPGGPCVPVGTTDQACGFCTIITCGSGFSCMSPSVTPLDRQCCHAVDQTMDCNSQCAAPAGCEHPTGQPWFCCENP